MSLSTVLKMTGLALVAAGVGMSVYNVVRVFPPEWTIRASVLLTAIGFVVYFSHYLVRRPAATDAPSRPDTPPEDPERL